MSVLLLALIVVGAPAAPAAADPPGIFAPALPRGITRLRGNVRPFLSVLDQGAGLIADLSLEHYFARAPLRLSLELAPLALALQADGPGSIAHLRFGAAYAANYLELGAAIGGRFQRYGRSGVSLAGLVRLGALDGYKLTVTYGYVLAPEGAPRAGLYNALSTFDIPIGRGLALFAEGGYSTEWWLFATAGLRHRLTGDGGPGTWIISGSLGVGWVFDQRECEDAELASCAGAAWAAGPTLGFGLERRF